MNQNNEWIKPEINSSLMKLDNIKYGLIDEKEEYCRIHKSNYTNEFHKTFNEKKWLGCPKCNEDKRIIDSLNQAKKDHQLRLEKIKESESIQQPVIKKAKGF